MNLDDQTMLSVREQNILLSKYAIYYQDLVKSLQIKGFKIQDYGGLVVIKFQNKIVLRLFRY